MMNFFKWMIDANNINANIFTLLTVVLSGGISLLISAAYFNKGNRSNLRASVLYPMQLILNGSSSWKQYNELLRLSKDYTVRYMHRNERNKMDALLVAYKNSCTYNYESMCAECLFSYFSYTLEQNGIDSKPVPIYIDDELVDVDFPPDLLYMRDDLCNWIEKRQWEDENDGFSYDGVVSIFNAYCKQCFTDKPIEFFKDFSYDEVIQKAKAHKEWTEKLEVMKKAKEDFLSMRVMKQ